MTTDSSVCNVRLFTWRHPKIFSNSKTYLVTYQKLTSGRHIVPTMITAPPDFFWVQNQGLDRVNSINGNAYWNSAAAHSNFLLLAVEQVYKNSFLKGEQHKKIKICYYLYIDIVIPKNIIKHTGLS